MKPEKHHRPSDDEAIEATAAAWLAQRDAGLTPAEAAEFAEWRQGDPRREQAVARLEATWGALQQLRHFRPESRMHPDRDLLRGNPPAARRLRFPAAVPVGLAACALLAAVWWWSAGTRGDERRDAQRFATTVEGYQRIALDDGSVLELNANSSVNVNFTPTERQVTLERGEAHFSVAKDKLRPFLVTAGAVAVRAIGTAFNVRLGAADVEVLVTEGRVEVDRASDRAVQRTLAETFSAPVSRESRVPPPLMILSASQRARIDIQAIATPPVIEKIAPEIIREELAWQGPRLVFIDTPLSEVAAQFNRLNQVQLVIEGVELGQLPIAGSFRAENVDAFVRLLATGNGIIAERPDAGHIVLRRGK